jgi:hypothetical protein
MRALHRIPLLAISTRILCKNIKILFVLIYSCYLVKCLKKLEDSQCMIYLPSDYHFFYQAKC